MRTRNISLTALTAVLALISYSVAAAPPTPALPNPPLQVREANVDGNDWIAVHEQGTAKVEVQGTADVHVTGGQIDAQITGGQVEINNTSSNPVAVEGTVSVDNFPNQQEVLVNGGELSVITQYHHSNWQLVPAEVQGPMTFTNPIYATFINIASGDAEVVVYLDTGPNVITFSDTGGDIGTHSISLTYPIPITGIQLVACYNESENCIVNIEIFGF